jgi:hypothetical protein
LLVCYEGVMTATMPELRRLIERVQKQMFPINRPPEQTNKMTQRSSESCARHTRWW